MFEKSSKIVFTIIFLFMVTVPLFTVNLVNGKVSNSEKRKLAEFPVIKSEDGSLNTSFNADFETWIDDNIGFREFMVKTNARIQYYAFRVLANNSYMYLGPKGELNYATAEMISDYQHNNLYGQDHLEQFASGAQIVNDYVVDKGAVFYYFQCWDKHSIYPEYFPRTIIQHGTTSKTDKLVDALITDSTVKVISPKEELISKKRNYDTYSLYGDPTHWTQRGAYVGYLLLMDQINQDFDNKYRVLSENDYDISMVDQGSTLFGGIHLKDDIENFSVKEPSAILTNEKLTLCSEDQRNKFYTNDAVDNDTRLLIIGDSYFESFLLDDLAESFHEVVFIQADWLWKVKSIIDEYDADIVVVEAAERVDRSQYFVDMN